jgi:Ubiquitin carboxyl-terminal hydrolase/Ubiquitin carboxyl-terminal hydrolase 47 C-terminal
MLPEFRKKVYAYKPNTDDPDRIKRDIMFQLQRLFAALQTGAPGAIRTKGLTYSFGWTDADMQFQHDLAELYGVLVDAIERSMASSTDEKCSTAGFFSASHESYRQCQTCRVDRTTDSRTICMCLQIRDVIDIPSALSSYFAPELMNESNAVTCPTCNSKQPHHVGVRIKSLPHVLAFQLARFDMNWDTMQRVKLTSEMCMPNKLDMSAFVPADTHDAEYELFAICVHMGSAASGHYVALIKQFSSGLWIVFNDAEVRQATYSEVADLFAHGLYGPVPDRDRFQTVEEKALAEALAAEPSSSSTIPTVPTAPTAPPAPPAPPIPSAPPAPPLPTGTEVPAPQGTSVSAHRSAGPESIRRHAYMVLYRRIDASNVDDVPDSDIPTLAVSEVKRLDAEFTANRKQHEYYVHNRALRIFLDAKSQQPHITLDAPIEETMLSLHQRVYDAVVDTIGSVPKNQTRLRILNEAKGLPERTLDDASSQVSTLETLPLEHNTALFFEVREEHQVFEPWTEDMLSLRLYTLEENKTDFSFEHVILVPKKGTVLHLRQAAASYLQADQLQTRIIVKQGEILNELGSNDISLSLHRIVDGDAVYAEVCANFMEQSYSAAKAILEAEASSIKISFNVPRNAESKAETDDDGGDDSGNDDDVIHEIDADLRQSLSSLKDTIAEILHKSVDDFKLLREAGDRELKQLSRPLSYFGIVDGGSVFVELGAPIPEGHYILKVFFQCPHDSVDEKKDDAATSGIVTTFHEDQFQFLGDVVFDAKVELPQMKQQLKDKFDSLPEPQFMRLREKNGVEITRFFVDGKPLRKNCIGLKDFKEIVIQRTTEANEVLTAKDVILQVCRWYPDQLRLGPITEIVLPKASKLELARDTFASAFDIPAEFIRFCKPGRWRINGASDIAHSAWHLTGPRRIRSLTLSSPKWRSRDGELIIVKDSRTAECPIEQRDADAHLANLAVVSSRTAEPALSIPGNQ